MHLLIVLVLVAAVVAIIARRLSLPYTVGLIVTGLGLSIFPAFEAVQLSRDLILQVFLPPLIFESAIHIRWDSYRKDLSIMSVLAVPGVVLSALATAYGMHLLVGWQLGSALVFGSLIAATDPVSVIATFKETPVDGRLQLLVEGESILNDGTSPVAFAVALIVATGSAVSPGSITWLTVQTIAGGILSGALVALVIMFLAWKTEDAMVDVALTLVAAYGSFLLAEHFHASGVLATMTAGLIFGNRSHLLPMQDIARAEVASFWEAAAFLVNSFVFMLIGVHRGHLGTELWMLTPVAVLVVMVGRAIAVYPCCAVFAPSSLRIPARYQHVLFWGGLRGAVALTLALSLPADLPHHEEILYATFTVVSFSIIFQGMTMTPLLRRLRLIV